jgi:hypothetical protein
MKKIILIWITLAAIHLHTNAQNRISAGAGYHFSKSHEGADQI